MMISHHSFPAANVLTARRANMVFRNLMDYAAIEQCLQAAMTTRLKIRENFAIEAATTFCRIRHRHRSR
jgi:hypothetical protein